MNYIISIANVKDGFQTSAQERDIALAISFAGGADACMASKDVPSETGQMLKVYLVRHILVSQENLGRGTAISESAPSGASRSFAQPSGENTKFSKLIDQIDRWGCVRKLLRRGSEAFIRGVGP